MVCRNVEAETSFEMPVTSSGDVLLLATVCAVGLPVEVQVKDGSIYSGVFHTASLDEGYGIVLKNARMIKKGRYPNLEVGTLVDTLVVLSKDLVQVVVKDFLLPTEEDIGFSVGDCLSEGIDAVDSHGTCATSGNLDHNQAKDSIDFCGDGGILEIHHIQKLLKSPHKYHNNFGGRDSCLCRDEVEEHSHRPAVSISEGLVGDNEANTRPEDCKSTSDFSVANPLSNTQIPTISTSFSSISTSPFLHTSEGNPFCNTFAKEFKLNPEAKIFFPSFVTARSNSSAIPTIANTSYLSNTFPTCAPLPTKFVQYSPLVAGQTAICTQYSQPMSVHVNARQLPARFIGQYHPSTTQTGAAYMHHNTQPVMVGRTGQLVYVHPISQDPMQGTTVLSQGFSVLTPCQVNIPKHQGTHVQSLQFCMAPPLVTATPVQPFAFPSPIQFSSSIPSIPSIRPIMVTGGNGFFGSKFQ